jgi:DNA topoisomerase VI subunit A
MNKMILEAGLVLGVTRRSLGVVTTAKGLICSGGLDLRDGKAAITGSTIISDELVERLERCSHIEANVKYLVVIEKQVPR